MTFKEIQDRVDAYLIDVPTATASEIPNWINSGVRVAQDRHNFRFMEEETQFVTTDATRKLANLPSDWKERRALPWLTDSDDGTKEIAWAASKSEMVRLFGESSDLDAGVPDFVLETDTQLDVWPLPDGKSEHGDGEYRVTVPYWGRFADLVNDGDTNWFTDNAFDYLTFYATAEGMIFNREEDRAAVYVQKAGQELARLIRRDKRSRIDNRFTLGFHSGAKGTRFSSRRQ